MKLYVLGPAFDLPSIDAECLATIALLQSCLQDNQPPEWTIVPSHDISLRLPYLQTSPSTRIHGLRNIAQHFETTRPSSTYLNSSQRATATALSSHLSTHARQLLDISLYVSYSNYTSTRTAFTALLPWHANYIVPPSLREAARRRTEHLGISSIDVEDVHDDLSDRPSGLASDVGKEKGKGFESQAKERASLLLPRGRDTVGSLLRRREGGGAVFKLHALARNLLDLLEEFLGDGDYFLGTDEPTEVDCEVFAYLALMLYPALPQDWLGRLVRGKYKTLVRFVERVKGELGLEADVKAVMALRDCKGEEEVRAMRREKGMALPWDSPAPAGVKNVTSMIVRDLVSRIPVVGPSTITIIPSTPAKPNFWRDYFPTIALTLAATVGACGYYAFTTGMLVWPRGQEIHIFGRKRLADYGHLGSALAGVSLLGRQATVDRQWEKERVNAAPGRVEVEVERQSGP